MNKERILMIADAIEHHRINGLGFNMSVDIDTRERRWNAREGLPDHSGHECGTVACIAGHGYVIKRTLENFELDLPKFALETVDFDEIAEWLEIDGHLSSCLFYGWYSHQEDELGAQRMSPVPLIHITAEQAVRTLRKFADTGEVDWSC